MTAYGHVDMMDQTYIDIIQVFFVLKCLVQVSFKRRQSAFAKRIQTQTKMHSARWCLFILNIVLSVIIISIQDKDSFCHVMLKCIQNNPFDKLIISFYLSI